MATKRDKVKVKQVERVTYVKYMVGGTMYEMVEGSDELPEGAKIIGWRTERNIATYEMDINFFLENAVKV